MNAPNVMRLSSVLASSVVLAALYGAQPANPGNAAATSRFDEPVGTIQIAGNWTRVDNGNNIGNGNGNGNANGNAQGRGNNRDVRLRSSEGQEVVVITDSQDGGPVSRDFGLTAQIVLQARQRALHMLSEESTVFEPPVATSDANSAAQHSYGHSATKHTRTAVRVEVTRQRIRTTLVFDTDAKSREDFTAWANALFEGIGG